jgi:hypothetical protein
LRIGGSLARWLLEVQVHLAEGAVEVKAQAVPVLIGEGEGFVRGIGRTAVGAKPELVSEAVTGGHDLTAAQVETGRNGTGETSSLTSEHT